jgi:hypothetical protein
MEAMNYWKALGAAIALLVTGAAIVAAWHAFFWLGLGLALGVGAAALAVVIRLFGWAWVGLERARLLATQRKTAEARRALIPEGFIGAQLARPEQAGHYHVWSFKQEWPTPRQLPTTVQEVPALALSEPAGADLPRAEPFSRLVSRIAPGHLILGFNTAGAIPGDLSDLLSTAIVAGLARARRRRSGLFVHKSSRLAASRF